MVRDRLPSKVTPLHPVTLDLWTFDLIIMS